MQLEECYAAFGGSYADVKSRLMKHFVRHSGSRYLQIIRRSLMRSDSYRNQIYKA